MCEAPRVALRLSTWIAFFVVGCGGNDDAIPDGALRDAGRAGVDGSGVAQDSGGDVDGARRRDAGSMLPDSGGVIAGLDFPGSAAVDTTMRFRFTSPLPIYPATYIWRAYPRRQAGYYTAFFWGNDDGVGDLSTFLWAPGGGADSYYGAHPYPRPPPSGTDHDWEISVVQDDFTNGAVEYDRWHVQALVVWGDSAGKHHVFYWDLPSTDATHRVEYTADASWGERAPPAPALTWGDAPWAPGNEVWNGVLRGIQIYETNLSLEDVMAEAIAPLSTSAGAASIWYLNLDPIPTDITDKSGQGNDPEWVGSERPALFVE